MIERDIFAIQAAVAESSLYLHLLAPRDAEQMTEFLRYLAGHGSLALDQPDGFATEEAR